MPDPCAADLVAQRCPQSCGVCSPPPPLLSPPPPAPATSTGHARAGPLFPNASRVIDVGASLPAALAVIEDHPLVLVMVYAPWCGNSRRISSYFEQAAAALENAVPHAVLVAMDCWSPGECAAANKFNYFPQFLTYLRGHAAIAYHGGTMPWEIAAHVARMAAPILTARNVQELLNLLKTSEIMVLASLPGVDSPAAMAEHHQALVTAAIELQDAAQPRGRVPVALADSMVALGLELPTDHDVVALLCMHDIEHPTIIAAPFVHLTTRVREAAMACRKVIPLNAWNYASELFAGPPHYIALLLLPLNQSTPIAIDARDFAPLQHALFLTASLPLFTSIRFATLDSSKFPALPARLGVSVVQPHLLLANVQREEVAVVTDPAILTNTTSLFDTLNSLVHDRLNLRPMPLRPALALSSGLPLLTADNYSAVFEHTPAAVLFFTPSCAFCKPALVVAEAAAPSLPVPLYAFNADGGLPDVDLSMVTSLPSLVVYRSPTAYDVLPLRHYTVETLRAAIDKALVV